MGIGGAALIGDELQKVVKKRFGTGIDLRIVHPMDTYKQGRSNGNTVGFLAGVVAFAGHEYFLHDGEHNGGFWLLFLFAVFAMALWISYRSAPRKISRTIKESIDIYLND